MKARLEAAGAVWAVTQGERWWTVGTLDGLIMNENLREVKPTSALGKKIMAAVEAAKAGGRG